MIRLYQVLSKDAYYWSSHSHAELDLLFFKGQKRFGFEFKYDDVPKFTRSMHIAFEDLKLDQLTLVHPGKGSYLADKKVRVVGLETLITEGGHS